MPIASKLIVLVILLGIFIPPPFVLATPPDSLVIAYNQDSQKLTVSGHHVTQDRLEHFIRRVIVTRNQDEPQKFYLTRQDSMSEFKTTIPIKLEPGDKVKIDVFCSQGGTKSTEYQLPKVIASEVKEKAKPQDLKAVKDNDHQNMPIIP